MSFFKGLAGGLARGVESALTLEDQRIEDQTKEALKEFKSRVKDQKTRRQTRQGKLENAIGRITAEGYSLTTAASLVKQNGIAGAEVIMKNGRLAIEAGIPRKDYIKEVTQATSPVALSKELSTVSQAAETLAFQAFPAVSREEFAVPKAPFSGSMISPEDDPDPKYRKEMLARFSESGVLPEQAKPEFESLPSGNTFTINRDLVPTAIELEKLRSDALRSTTEKLWDTLANGTDAEKAAAKATLSGMETIKSNDALAELRNKLLDKTTTKEESAAILQRLQDFTNSNLSSEDKLKKFSDAVISLTSQFKTTVDSQFSRTLITPKLEPLSDKAALLKQKSPGQKEQFVINGERSALVDVGSPKHTELETKYLMERRKRVVSLLDQQPNIPELYRQRIEANLLPEEQQVSGSGESRTEVDFKETTSEEPPEVTPKFDPENIRNLREAVDNFPNARPNATLEVVIGGKRIKVTRAEADKMLKRVGVGMRDGVTVDEKEDTRINTVANLLLKNVKLGILDDVSSRSKGGLGGRVLNPATTRSPRGQAKDRAVYIQERINLDDDIAKQQVSQKKLAEVETLMPIFLDRTGEYSSLSEEEKEAEFLKQVKNILGD